MTYGQRRPVMPKSSKRKFDDISDGEQVTPEVLEPSALENRKIKAVFGRLKNRSSHASGHNCPCKDAGTTHAFKPSRCFPQQHAGYCPGCNAVVCWKKGCPMGCTKNLHRCKGEDLLPEPLAQCEVHQYQKEHNIIPGKPSWKANTQPEIQSSFGTKSNKKGPEYKKPRFK